MSRIAVSLLAGIVLLGSFRTVRTPQTNVISSESALPPTQGAGTVPNSSALTPDTLRRNEDGPWVAVCRYFASYDPDSFPSPPRGDSAALEPGVQATPEFRQTVEEPPSPSEQKVGKGIEERPIADPASCVPSGTAVTASYLIALVPDPINSHLALEYDRSLESIQRAPTLLGFNFDRYWIPWDELYAQPQSDLEKARLLDRDRHLREEEPGLFLFHRWKEAQRRPEKGPAGHAELLFVFLVGETPTYGVNKIALSKSLLYVSQLSSKFAHVQPKVLGVAGPHFSGSLHSLARVLESVYRGERAPVPQQLAIVSGSVTGPEAISEFNEVAESLSHSGRRVAFQELTYDDSARLPCIVKQLREVVGAKPDEIALLTETTSAYHPGSAPLENAQPPAPGACDNRELTALARLTFPRGIAPLRNAYQATQDSIGHTAPKPQPQLPQMGLPLTYRDNEIRDQENVAPAANNQTPLSQDAVLQQIGQALRQHNIKVVLLFATDALDQMFLLHYLRETSPNIRVAIANADLLYVRPADPHDFTGTITFSVYPLFTSSTALSGRDLPGVQTKFPSSLAESDFFAVLSLLHPNLRYYNPMSGEAEVIPKLWMGVLGKTGYWPLRPVKDAKPGKLFRHCPEGGAGCDDLKSVYSSTDSGQVWRADAYVPARPSRLWGMMALLVSLTAILHSLAVLTPLLDLAKLGNRWWLEYFCLDHGDGNYVQARAFFLFFATAQLAIADAVFLLPWVSLYTKIYYAWNLMGVLKFAGAMLAIVLTIAVLLLTFISIFVMKWKSQTPRTTELVRKETKVHNSLRFVAAASFVGIAAVLGTWATLCLRGEAALAFSARATELTSGVCPSLPVLFIATGLYIWALGCLKRITYFQNRAAHFPTVHFDEVLKSDFPQLQKNLCATLSPVSLPTSASVFCLVIVAFCLGLYLWLDPRSLESAPYNTLVLVGVWAIWSTLLFNTVRLMVIWLALKKVLRRLERLPIRYAFSRIPSTFSWSPVWRRGGMRRSYLAHARSLEYLRCLSCDSPAPVEVAEPAALSASLATGTHGGTTLVLRQPIAVPGISPAPRLAPETWAGKIFDGLSEVVALETKGLRVTSRQRKYLDDALLGAASEITEFLSPEWAKGGADASAPAALLQRTDLPSRAEGKDELRMLAGEFVALRFVAVFRYVSLQMRNLLTTISAGFILALLALKSYPFQPREGISWWLVAAFVLMTAAVTYVLVDMDRDAILSRISKTRAGKLDSDLLWPLLRFGALPLLTIVAAQFPSVSNFLFSWVQPTLDALR